MHSDSFEQIADQFLDKCRQGTDPTIDHLAIEHPEHSEDIKEVLPTALLLEQFKRQKNYGRVEADRGVKFGQTYIRRLGDYRIIREIGRGGMGIVYEAEQESLKRRVALKVLRPSLTMDDKTARRFEREAQAAAGLHHTNIVPVFGVGQQDDIRYYVMQLITGTTLDKVTKDRAQESDHSPSLAAGSAPTISRQMSVSVTPHSSQLLDNVHAIDVHAIDDSVDATKESRSTQSGSTEVHVGAVRRPDDTAATVSRPPTDWRWMASVGIEVCDALAYAHSHGILHRDVKPGNVLVDETGGVWITDFGLAKPADSAEITASGDAVGTLRYMAPEQLDGVSNRQTDVYSLGITLYELATGTPAYVHKDRAQLLQMIVKQEPSRPRKLAPDIPRDFETIILKSIAREPERRYQTAAEFRDDLERFLQFRPIRARRAGVVERMWRWCRRNPAVALPTLLSFILLVCLAAVSSTGYWKVKNALAETDQERQRAHENQQRAESNWQKAETQRNAAETERQRAERTLKLVQEEQARAKANLELSLDALDAVFKRFAPDPLARNQDVEAEDGDDLDPRFDLVITKEDVALLKSMLQFYDDFARQNKDDRRLQREAAKANRRVGDIHARLGAFAEAQGAYDRALAMYKEASTGLPIEHELRRQLASVQNDLGLVLKMQGRFNAARNLHLSALGSLRQQLALAPDSVEINLELVRTYNFLGYTIWGSFRRRTSEDNTPTLVTAAEENHRAAVETLAKLIAKDANNPEYQLMLARSHRDIAPVLLYGQFENRIEAQGNETEEQKKANEAKRLAEYRRRQDEAAESLGKSRNILGSLVERYPQVPTYKYELVLTLTRRSRRPFSEEEHRPIAVDMIDNHLIALTLAEELHNDYPDVPEYSARIAFIERSLARLYESVDDLESAERYYRLAFAQIAEQVNNYSQVPQYQLYAGAIGYGLMGILQANSKNEEARVLALEFYEKLKVIRLDDRRDRAMLFFVRDRISRTLCELELAHSSDGEHSDDKGE